MPLQYTDMELTVSGVFELPLNDFFNTVHLKEYFKERLLHKDGGGRDRFSPSLYWRKFQHEFPYIAEKCLSGTYRFSAYNERLILKGKNEYPRVISIPTVRDRLVLGVLNEYLQHVFPECINHHVPNHYIFKINQYIEEHKSEEIKFLKTDFHAFYDNINQRVLIEKLEQKIKDPAVINLIKGAIQTPTINNIDQKVPNLSGIPQGLVISNILAAIYMKEFDDDYQRMGAGLYLRYVDDILFLQPHDNLEQIMKEYIADTRMQLKFNETKTKKGIIGLNELDYIGYLLNNGCITMRKKNVNRFIDRLAKECTRFTNEYRNKELRPLFIAKDNEFIDFFIANMNMTISGFKTEFRLYGWLPYYRQINDISLMYRLDKILRKNLLKDAPPEILTGLHSFVDSYYAIKEKNGGRLLFDFDQIDTIAKKKSYLYKKGRLDKNREYTDEQVNIIFNQYLRFLKKKTEQNIGYFG